jgi:hypothetical protein
MIVTPGRKRTMAWCIGILLREVCESLADCTWPAGPKRMGFAEAGKDAE